MFCFFRNAILGSLLFFWIQGIAQAQSPSPWVLSTSNEAPNATEDFQGIGDRLMLEAFRQLQIPLKIERLPSERALIRANEGEEDGNFARVEGLEKQYPNLIRVPEELVRFEFVAFAKKDRKNSITTWEKLKDYHVGIVTGWKILEANIQGTRSLTKVDRGPLLFGMLDKEKIDFAIFDRRQGMVMSRELKLAGIAPQDTPLAVKSMYLYLHQKHRDQVPKIQAVLARMKRDGVSQRIANEVLGRYGLND